MFIEIKLDSLAVIKTNTDGPMYAYSNLPQLEHYVKQ